MTKPKVLIISRSWGWYDKNGLPLIAQLHAEIMDLMGFEVSVAYSSNKDYLFPKYIVLAKRFPVRGRLKWLVFYNFYKNEIKKYINLVNPDIVFVESLQTGICESFAIASKELGRKVVLISHGVNLHHSWATISGIIKNIYWSIYKLNFFKLMNKFDHVMTLSSNSKSSRFFDRDVAVKLKIPVSKFENLPVNWQKNNNNLINRKNQILVVGYFSEIKNQLEAIRMLMMLPSNLHLKLIGEKTGKYYRRCMEVIKKNGYEERVEVLSDKETNLANEYGSSIVTVIVSKTEVMPVVLLESLASCTPVLSFDLGCISEIYPIGIVANVYEMAEKIKKLQYDKDYWEYCSMVGKACIEKNFKKEKLIESFKLVFEKHNIGKF